MSAPQHKVREFVRACMALGMVLVCFPWIAWAGQATVEHWMGQLHHPHAQVRQEAALHLAEMGKQATPATDALLHALADADVDVRVAASYAIVCVQSDPARSLRGLLPLLSDSNEHVRYSAEWSIARLAKELADGPILQDARELKVLFEQAQRSLTLVEHQARNRQAIDLVLSKLALEIGTPTVSPEHRESQAEEQKARALVIQSFQSLDVLGKYQFLHRLADPAQASDGLRLELLQQLAKEDQDGMLRYAMVKWGSQGEATLQAWIRGKPWNQALEEYEARLIRFCPSHDPIVRDHLLGWATDASQELPVRVAATEALGKGISQDGKIQPQIVRMIVDRGLDIELRVAALEALGQAGTHAVQEEGSIARLLVEEKDEWIRSTALETFRKIAYESSQAGPWLASFLGQIKTEDLLLIDLVRTCAAFGPRCAAAVPRLIELHTMVDQETRCEIIEAFGKIQAQPRQVGQLLVQRILDSDESIAVKNRCASALEKLGPEAIQELFAAIVPENRDAYESLLQSIAVLGPKAKAADPLCRKLVDDATQPLEVRVAAAHALGAMQAWAQGSVPVLMKNYAEGRPEPLRAACLLAMVRIDPRSAMPFLEVEMENESLFMKAHRAFSFHFLGRSRESFDQLMELVQGSDVDFIVENILRDMGDVIDPWLYETAIDTARSRDQRMLACKLACVSKNPDWKRLLLLANDFEYSEDFGLCLASYWHTTIMEDPGKSVAAIDTLLEVVERESLEPMGKFQVVQLLTPDGLGAGDDEEGWKGLTLATPESAQNLWRATQPVVMAEALPEEDAAKAVPSSPKKRSPPSPSAQAGMPPESNATAQSAEPSAIEDRLYPDRNVDVFYGTNRARVVPTVGKRTEWQSRLHWSGILGSMATFLVCGIALWRTGSRGLVVFPIAGIAALVPAGIYSELLQGDSSQRVEYGGTYSSVIEYGMCSVSIPPIHKPGGLESPNLLKLEIKMDAAKHVVLQRVEPMSHDAFHEQLQKVQQQRGKNVLVFVHGYNVSFEDAARRTAQMAYDLKFPGAPIFYSWPSQANWYGYRQDQENIQLSVDQIKQFLTDIAEKSGADTINLVAHSMGNVGLTEALREIQTQGVEPRFNQVVLAAPDIDADVFLNRIAPQIVGKAKRTTLYTSQSDLALVASRYFNNGTRAGDSGERIVLYPGIDTIDATAVDSSLLGHSYYGSNISVLSDLGSLLRNLPIQNRHYLRKIEEGASGYWAFDPVRVAEVDDDASLRVK